MDLREHFKTCLDDFLHFAKNRGGAFQNTARCILKVSRPTAHISSAHDLIFLRRAHWYGRIINANCVPFKPKEPFGSQ